MDSAFTFNLSAEGEDIQIRASEGFSTCISGNGASVTTPANMRVAVDGSSCEVTSMETTGDSVVYTSEVDPSNYSYISFWFRWVDASGNTTAFEVSDLGVFTADTNDGTEDNIQTLSSSNIAGSPNYLTEGTWYLVKDVPVPSNTNSSDIYLGLYTANGSALASSDVFFVDQMSVYNEKIEIDLSSDADLAVFKRPVRAWLKESGIPVAVAYIDVVSLDSDGDGQVDFTDGSSATVTFLANLDTIEVPQGTTKTFTFELSTMALLNEDDGDDPLLFSIDYGSAAEGAITPGDLWWYESNRSVQWLGAESASTLYGNLLNY